MTAEVTGSAADRRQEGAVRQDEGAARSTVEDSEAVAMPSVGELLRGLTIAASDRRPPLEPAPGSYVRDPVPAAAAPGGQRHAVARCRK